MKLYRLIKRHYPYVPSLEGYGPGCAIPWPKFDMLSVGYSRIPECPGNLYIPDPDQFGNPNGGKWRIITIWQTGWMAIQSVITGQVIFSVPPGTLEEM